MTGPVEIDATAFDGSTLPECPVVGCESFRSHSHDRMLDHLMDDHDLLGKIFERGVVVRE